MTIDEKYLDSIEIIPLIDTLRLQKIDDAEYFSKSYKEYISNSRLSLIDPNKDGSPEKFFEGFKLVYNPSFQLGIAVHGLVLQPDRYKLVGGIYKPTAKLGLLADRIYNICKGELPTVEIINNEAKAVDYYKGNLNKEQINNVLEKCSVYWSQRRLFESTYDEDKELIYLDEKMSQAVLNCVTRISSNKYMQDLLHPTRLINPIISENEQAVLLDIQINIPDKQSFILKFKAKLDNYTIDCDLNTITVNDIKTISKIVSEITSNIKKFSYNRELAIYSWLLSLCASKYYQIDNPTIKANYLVVSTIPQYYTKVVPMTKSMYKEGWNEFKFLLRLVAYYYSKGYRFD